MKEIKKVQLIGFGLFVIYCFLIVADLLFDYWGDYSNLALSILLAVISLNMIHKGMLLRSGSTLWFAVSLILFAILIIIFEIINIDPFQYYFVFTFIPIIASLINVAIFQNLIYIKVIIINISIILPILIMYFTDLSIWWIIGIGVVGLIAGIIVCRNIVFNKEKV